VVNDISEYIQPALLQCCIYRRSQIL